eukprot:9834477-Heterocapsa_arctica.AAC.1
MALGATEVGLAASTPLPSGPQHAATGTTEVGIPALEPLPVGAPGHRRRGPEAVCEVEPSPSSLHAQDRDRQVDRPSPPLSRRRMAPTGTSAQRDPRWLAL